VSLKRGALRTQFYIRGVQLFKPPASGALLHECHEPLGLGRGEVDVVRDAVPAGDADREPAVADAQSRLALGKRAQGIGSCEFRHGSRLRK